MCGSTAEGDQGICPNGWHIPTDSEWTTLENNVCGDAGDEGSALAGNAGLWADGSLKNDGDFDCSGFDLLPGGYRSPSGSYYYLGSYARLWSSSEDGSSHAWYRRVNYGYTDVYRHYYYKDNGMPVRCIKYDDPCDPMDCSCGGTGYETLNCSNGDTVYVDCNADKCWSPTATERNWDNAVSYCNNLNHGGKTDWSLPSRNVLQSLCHSGSCSGRCFGGEGASSYYWSSTGSGSYTAYGVYFANCFTTNYDKYLDYYVRCVR
jgi:uncharacterized protein (TIGR02145 family)